MIGQYLSNTNESATVSIFQNFLELNKALMLHAYVARFDVTKNLEKFLILGWTKQSLNMAFFSNVTAQSQKQICIYFLSTDIKYSLVTAACMHLFATICTGFLFFALDCTRASSSQPIIHADITSQPVISSHAHKQTHDELPKTLIS